MSLTINQNKSTKGSQKTLGKTSFRLWSMTSMGLITTAFLGLTLAPTGIFEDTHATSTASEMNVNLATVLSMEVAVWNPDKPGGAGYDSDVKDMNLSIRNGEFKTLSARIATGTNNPTGYTLTFEDNDTDNNLRPSIYDGTDSYIAPVDNAGVTIDDPTDSGNDFPANTWGYAFQTTSTSAPVPSTPLTYLPVPVSSTEVSTPTEAPGSENHYLTIASRVGSNLPPNSYQDQVTFTLVANAAPVTVQYMQDIATICPTLNEGDTAQLVDKRDNQEYTVFKAKDGNCWMSENLRYGINPDGTAHPYIQADAALSDNIDTAADLKMQDLTYDSTNPNTAGRIKNGSSGMKTADGSANAFNSDTEGYTEPYINIYQANDVATYDGQTKYGVLYNYCAATGGTACTASSTDYNPTGSVCPKGWKLPGMNGDPTGSGTGTTDGSVKTYDNVFNLYGVTDDDAGFNKIIASPLNFVRSGLAYNGSLRYRSFSGSGNGDGWSSTKYTSANYSAYNLAFGSGFVGRSLSNYSTGRSARCVSES